MSTPKKPILNFATLDDANLNWLTSWQGWPGTIEGLRAWLKTAGISVTAFKQTARYQANVGRLPWLKDL